MKLGRSTVCAVSVFALSIGAAFAGEDSTHRFNSTGPEWHEVTSSLYFQDADSEPGNAMPGVDAGSYSYERYDYPA